LLDELSGGEISSARTPRGRGGATLSAGDEPSVAQEQEVSAAKRVALSLFPKKKNSMNSLRTKNRSTNVHAH